MNPSKILLSLSFLLISFSAHSAAPDTVLDINKKNLIAGVAYYVLPVVRGQGGGLTLSTTNSTEVCPTFHVAQARSEVDQGLSLSFLPVNPKKGVVRVSTDHNILFSVAETTCVNSTVGKLAYEESTMKYYVTVGGVRGKPGQSTVDNWFKIEKYESDYKLHFCPTVCNFCKVICRDFGIFIDGEGRRVLALSDDPFRVMFKKAKTFSN